LPQKNEDPVKCRIILDLNMMAEELLDWILQALFKTNRKKTKRTNSTVLLRKAGFLPEGDLLGLTLDERKVKLLG